MRSINMRCSKWGSNLAEQKLLGNFVLSRFKLQDHSQADVNLFTSLFKPIFLLPGLDCRFKDNSRSNLRVASLILLRGHISMWTRNSPWSLYFSSPRAFSKLKKNVPELFRSITPSLVVFKGYVRAGRFNMKRKVSHCLRLLDVHEWIGVF